jgi:hypothetical protein
MLNHTDQNGRMEGIKICHGAPSFNHLLFADDSLILLKVSEESAHHLQLILNLYEVCSRQTVNMDKSSIVFSKNTRLSERRKMMAILGVVCEGRNGKYLACQFMWEIHGKKPCLYQGPAFGTRSRAGRKRCSPKLEKKS